MKVKELINELSHFNSDAEINFTLSQYEYDNEFQYIYYNGIDVDLGGPHENRYDLFLGFYKHSGDPPDD